MKKLLQKAQTMAPYLTKIRHRIHENPELGLKEYDTTELIRRELTAMGVELQPVDMETGVVGLIRGEKTGTGPVTAIRADIDALPISEQTDRSYASKNAGIMHACGHDGHAAVLLGTAKLLMTLKESFSGVVKLIFQPGEESGNGAEKMVLSGVLESPHVDSIVALHGWPPFTVGTVGAWPGKYMASADEFRVVITGKGGHGCRPYMAVNPIVAAAQAITALQNIVSSEIVTAEQAVISVCRCHGGSSATSIPDQMVFEGTVRCLDEGVRRQLKESIDRVVKNTALAFGCTCGCEYMDGLPPLSNDPDTVKHVLEAAEKALGEDAVLELDGPVMGAEDFSFFAAQVKQSAFFRLGVGDPGEEPRVLHNNRFDFNDRAIPVGMAVLAQYVLDTNG